ETPVEPARPRVPPAVREPAPAVREAASATKAPAAKAPPSVPRMAEKAPVEPPRAQVPAAFPQVQEATIDGDLSPAPIASAPPAPAGQGIGSIGIVLVAILAGVAAYVASFLIKF